jgi:hypothetical protein
MKKGKNRFTVIATVLPGWIPINSSGFSALHRFFSVLLCGKDFGFLRLSVVRFIAADEEENPAGME